MATYEHIKVKIVDLCALVNQTSSSNLTILFPECRMPQKAVAADPNPEHRLAIRILATGDGAPFQFPDHWDEQVRRVTIYDDENQSQTYFLWFPTDCDLRIQDGEPGDNPPPDMTKLRPFMFSFGEVYPDRPDHSKVDPRYLVPSTDDRFVKDNLDGRLFMGTGSLEAGKKTNPLKHWDNSYDEHNRVEVNGPERRLADEIIWKPELKKPTLQAKRFEDESWHNVLPCTADIEIFNAPVATFLELPSWYKFDGELKSPELMRSKHFQIVSFLCQNPPKPRDNRIPYFREEKPGVAQARPKSYIHPPACPPGYYEEDD